MSVMLNINDLHTFIQCVHINSEFVLVKMFPINIAMICVEQIVLLEPRNIVYVHCLILVHGYGESGNHAQSPF